MLKWLFAFARSKEIKATDLFFPENSCVLVKETLFMILGGSWIIAPKSLDPYFTQ